MKFHAAKAATLSDLRNGGIEAAKPVCGESLAKAFSDEGLRTVPHEDGREIVNCERCLASLTGGEGEP